MQLYRAFMLSKLKKKKKGKTQVNRCRIQSVDSLIKVYTKFIITIEVSCSTNQYLSKISVDAPVPALACICQSTARNLTTNSHMVEFLLHRAQANLYIPEAFSVG